ncbi:stage II sporulation protein E [Clostridium celatum]|uniref:stage II sporulation protein E n=1 Tax=Clostridium celatum TaxID=36834 RepID=UPI00319E6CBE
MQYGVDIPTYKRKENKKSKKKTNVKNISVKIGAIIILGFMLSRVGFGFIDGLYLAPFGLGYLISVIKKSNIKESTIAFLSVALGYLSQYLINRDIIIYISIAAAILGIKYISSLTKKEVQIKNCFAIVIAMFVGLQCLLGNQDISINIFFSLVKSLIVIPVFFMINYGVNCMKEINSNYFYSTEELISLAILVCLIITGVGEFNIAGIAIRDVLALAVIITVAYAAGSNAGAVLGVTMGLIIGVGNNDIMISTTLYGICGLVVGLFTETGKIFSILAYFVVSFIVMTYSNNLNSTMIIQIAASALIMALIPKNVIKKLLSELNNDEKSKVISDAQIEGIKSEFVDRLEVLRGSLVAISSSVENLSGNEKLLLKNKGTALVENLADRVCQECEMNSKCWGRELHTTFSQFGELMQSCENKNAYLPKTLDKKCVKRNTLLKNAEELYSTYTVNEALKSRLMEARSILASQMSNMSFAVTNILKDFNQNVDSCLEVDKLLRKTLAKNKIRYINIYSFVDTNGRLKIKVKVDSYDGENYCRKQILPVISNLIKTPLYIGEKGCVIDPSTNECSVIIEETPKYHISSYVAFEIKDGEKYSGDSYSFGDNKSGQYVTIISDGMGSGPEAGLESGAAIDLIERFIDGGFSETTMLNTVNAVMGMKFSEAEKFTTLDMNIIDLYTGDAKFIKVGGSMSFIKHGNEVEVISNSTLPFGIVDTINVTPIKKKVKQGDIIITVSDGIVDVDRDNLGDYNWIVEYLKDGPNNPEALSREIIDKAKKISGGRVLDDMTIVVSKLYSSY